MEYTSFWFGKWDKKPKGGRRVWKWEERDIHEALRQCVWNSWRWAEKPAEGRRFSRNTFFRFHTALRRVSSATIWHEAQPAQQTSAELFQSCHVLMLELCLFNLFQ